jgi:hypothetical protein
MFAWHRLAHFLIDVGNKGSRRIFGDFFTVTIGRVPHLDKRSQHVRRRLSDQEVGQTNPPIACNGRYMAVLRLPFPSPQSRKGMASQKGPSRSSFKI